MIRILADKEIKNVFNNLDKRQTRQLKILLNKMYVYTNVYSEISTKRFKLLKKIMLENKNISLVTADKEEYIDLTDISDLIIEGERMIKNTEKIHKILLEIALEKKVW